MPWKNGGGYTNEIAACPMGASLDTFGWRISRAQVTADGPFSQFPGIDRTLAILEGAGLVLTVSEAPPVQLSRQSPPFTFAADKASHATLIDGPITDLNVMSRRSHWRHTVDRIDTTTPLLMTPEATEWLIYCRAGTVRLSADGLIATMKQHDAVTGNATHLNVEPEEPSGIYVIAFRRL